MKMSILLDKKKKQQCQYLRRNIFTETFAFTETINVNVHIDNNTVDKIILKDDCLPWSAIKYKKHSVSSFAKFTKCRVKFVLY